MPKLRSATTTQGRNMAGARALRRATGVKDSDFGKPFYSKTKLFTINPTKAMDSSYSDYLIQRRAHTHSIQLAEANSGICTTATSTPKRCAKEQVSASER